MSMKSKYFSDKMKDIFMTDIFYVMPGLLKWFYERRIKRNISRFRLNNSSKKLSSIYQHGELDFKKNSKPILILHGLYSHPFIMLNLAKAAKASGFGPVFSLFVSYDEQNLENHRNFLGQALDHIENLVGKESKIILVGHSMGAIEAAFRALVEKDKRILSVISIAGRLNTVDPCSDNLKDTLNKINHNFLENSEFPLYQIVAGKDWNASLDSTIINKKPGFYTIIKDAMHFNILYNKDLKNKFLEHLKTIHQNN